jgi:hypothetical protein
MAFAAWQATIVDDSGNVVPNAAIEVLREVAGQPPAQCYSDRNGSTPIGSTFNADSDGFVRFFVAGGAYQITATSGAFSRVWRYVAIGRASESDGGVVPTSVSTAWAFDSSTTDADPGSGEFRLNNATPASATAIYVDNNNVGGNDVTAWLATLDDSGDGTVRGLLTICDPEQPTEVFRIYAVSGTVGGASDSPDPGYRTLAVTHIAGAGSFTAGAEYSFSFSPRGPAGEGSGDVSSSLTLTAGAGLTGGGDLSTNRTFDVGAGTGIVANANDVAVDKASDANVRAAASNKVITSDLLESAAAFVALTDAATVALDWDAGVNFSLQLTTNRALGNPTNGQPGTWRTIYLSSDGGPDALSFGNQYFGPAVADPPADVTTTMNYVLAIYCVTASAFVVSAIPVDVS